MRNRGLAILTFLAVLATAAFGLYRYYWPTVSWTQQITVEIDVSGVTYSGTGTTKVRITWQPRLLPDITTLTSDVSGEAAAVALPDGRYVFALLSYFDRNIYSAAVAGDAFRDLGGERDAESWKRATLQLPNVHATRELPPELYPPLVTFGDINKSESAVLLEPQDLAAELGEGVRLRRVLLTINPESETQGETRALQQILPWLTRNKGKNLDPEGDPFNPSFARLLMHGDFLR
ncbi:MAG: hypothetical protein H6892_08305 [Brucellaceae bacterium]|nr:hypothetical protein [Brucellaceae bacterium]